MAEHRVLVGLFCKVCGVLLEGERELDEGRGTTCLTCQIGELESRIRRLEKWMFENGG